MAPVAHERLALIRHAIAVKRQPRPQMKIFGPPKPLVAEYMRNESRFRVVERSDPARFRGFLKDAQEAARQRYAMYQQLAGITVPQPGATTDDESSPAAPGREA